MIELADDEQEIFTKRMVKEAMEGKTPSSRPTFYALVGAPGSGKSSMAKNIKNAVVICSDHVIGEYAKELDIDISNDFYDKDVSLFAVKVSNEIYKAAVKNKMDIVYDTSVLYNTKKMVEHVKKFGYQTQIKLMLTDEYQAAMNVIERKMNVDNQYFMHKRYRDFCHYPSGNLFAVSPYVSMNVSAAVEDFLGEMQLKKEPIEVYEFGKTEPSFKTGDDFDKFIDNMKLIPMEDHIKRCDKLIKRAMNEGRDDDAINLIALKKEMTIRQQEEQKDPCEKLTDVLEKQNHKNISIKDIKQGMTGRS